MSRVKGWQDANEVIGKCIERAINQQMDIEIRVRFSESGLFGNESTDQYEVRDSMEKYEDMLREALQNAFPTASITIEQGDNDDHRLEYQPTAAQLDEGISYIEDEQRDQLLLAQIIDDTWQSWEWMVEAENE